MRHSLVSLKGEYQMRKLGMVLAAVATLGLSSVTAPGSAEARGFGHHHGGFGPALAGGLIAGALIGGLASSAYGYGPGYYGYGPAYYGGYAPAAYYGDYGYAPVYRYRRVVRPAFAFYGGPRFHRGFHHRWHHHRHW